MALWELMWKSLRNKEGRGKAGTRDADTGHSALGGWGARKQVQQKEGVGGTTGQQMGWWSEAGDTEVMTKVETGLGLRDRYPEWITARWGEALQLPASSTSEALLPSPASKHLTPPRALPILPQQCCSPWQCPVCTQAGLGRHHWMPAGHPPVFAHLFLLQCSPWKAVAGSTHYSQPQHCAWHSWAQYLLLLSELTMPICVSTPPLPPTTDGKAASQYRKDNFISSILAVLFPHTFTYLCS